MLYAVSINTGAASLTNELVAGIEKAHKNKIEDASGHLMTARLVNCTM